MRTILNLLNGNKRIVALVIIGINSMLKRYPDLAPVLGGIGEAEVIMALDWIAGIMAVWGTAHAIIKKKAK